MILWLKCYQWEELYKSMQGIDVETMKVWNIKQGTLISVIYDSLAEIHYQ